MNSTFRGSAEVLKAVRVAKQIRVVKIDEVLAEREAA
jgi:hypothetical protein